MSPFFTVFFTEERPLGCVSIQSEMAKYLNGFFETAASNKLKERCHRTEPGTGALLKLSFLDYPKIFQLQRPLMIKMFMMMFSKHHYIRIMMLNIKKI